MAKRVEGAQIGTMFAGAGEKIIADEVVVTPCAQTEPAAIVPFTSHCPPVVKPEARTVSRSRLC